jgi:outer membrane protein insertion porin family
VVLNVSVVEQSTGEYGLSAGYASDAGLLGEVSVTERNFLGRGQYVKASISASQSGQSYDFSFTEPRFMGLKMSAGFDVYHRINAESSSYIYGTTATGGQIRLGVPVTRDVNFSVFTGLETKTVEDGDSPFSNILLEGAEVPGDADGKTFNKAWIGYTLAYSGVDNTKNPTEGLVASWTTQYIGWDFNLVKSEAKARYFMPLLADANIIGSVRGQAGIVASLDGDSVSPLEAFKMSSTLVRGFQSGSLGPKFNGGSYNEALGYTSYALASAEIEFPIPVIPETYGLRGAVWADAAVIDGHGTDLTPTAGSIDDNLKASVGVSVIWDSPFGPLRGDFAHVLNKATEDKTQVFQLSIQQLL